MTHWENIGHQIKQLREAQDLTQAELGEQIGASRHFISDVENGNRKCSVDRLKDIAGALNHKLVVPNKL